MSKILRSNAAIVVIGILMGIICRLSDLFPYEDLWSLSSIATLFGFWIVSVSVITMYSTSHKTAFKNTFLYMFSMTLAFYTLKYLLGLFVPQFDNDGVFQTNLFLVYTGLSIICGFGSAILYYWNRDGWYSSILYALPVGALFAEGIACGIILFSKNMLLVQTIFDLAAACWFFIVLGKRAQNKWAFVSVFVVFAAIVFLIFYRNWINF